MGKLLVIGGAHVDRQARLAAPHLPHTSNPVSMLEEAGGGALNAARAVRRFGHKVALLSARGADSGAALVEAALAQAGIDDLSGIHLDRATPSYTAILEPGGELVTAIADMALYETALGKSLRRAPVVKAAATADALLCDANMLPDAIGAAIALAAGKPVFVLAISAAKAKRLSGMEAAFSAVFMNRHEASALTGLAASAPAPAHAQSLQALGFRRAIVSAGGEVAAIMAEGTITTIAPPRVAIVDVTGAGDALAGTAIACLMAGMPFVDAARHGLAAASLTAARQGATPALDRADIETLARSLAETTP
jgi:sugar/nucleoside kinase (ribokinase family)